MNNEKTETAVTILEDSKSLSSVMDTSEEKIVLYNNIKYEYNELNEKNKFLYNLSKRIFDVCLSLLALILLSPFLLIVSLIIKLEDKNASIIFKQERVGINGKKFYMYKFRSMVNNAEELLESLSALNEVEGAMFKIKNDPRVTKIGKFMRATSIDELPQLYNVMIGDMSLVGPRPPLEKEVALYSSYDMKRLSVTPGCTGLWQATVRNSVGFKEMVELDLTYINKRSFLFDLKIIFMTIFSMISKKSY